MTKIRDYDYNLPADRIAKFPLPERDGSKLLVYDHGRTGEDIFRNLPHYIPEGELMVFNNTRVIQARMHFHKSTGALIEVFLLEPLMPRDYEQVFQTTQTCSWLCMIGNLKKWKDGGLSSLITINGRTLLLQAVKDDSYRLSHPETQYHKIDLSWNFVGTVPSAHRDNPCGRSPHLTFAEVLEAVGELPIPPYLDRETQESDKTTYQTVYSKIKGSVAAPTAGLHFTDKVLADLDRKGVEREELTLHVGAGTFKPVKTDDVEQHEMHTEYISVRRQTIERLIAHGGRATAVGTTSVRTLESLYYIGRQIAEHNAEQQAFFHVSQWEPYGHHTDCLPVIDALYNILDYMQHNDIDTLHASTQIIIVPGYEYKIVNRLITNFHQPKSTLLLLVSAFLHGDWHSVYDYALAHNFRFLSYGDSSLLMP